MKFITRALYDGMQGGPSSWRRAERRWEAASEAKERRFQAIQSQLPERMREFAALTLHDGEIKSVDNETPGEVRLLIDGSDCPWGPGGQFELTFLGVRRAENLEGLVGDTWLYEEVDLHPDAGFEFSVLLHRGEFSVIADDVAFRLLDGEGGAA